MLHKPVMKVASRPCPTLTSSLRRIPAERPPLTKRSSVHAKYHIISSNFADMVRNIQLRVSLKEAEEEGILRQKIARHLGLSTTEFTFTILRKSIDARKPTIYFNYKLAVYRNEKPVKKAAYS